MIDTSTPSFEPSSDFDNLKLSIMPLNLNKEKARISLGRSGSMTKRRPPTRPRSLLISDDPEPIITLPPDNEPASKEYPQEETTPLAKESAPKIKLSELSSNADRIGMRAAMPTVKSIKSEMAKSATFKKSGTEKSQSKSPHKSPTIVRNESLKSPKIFRSLIGNRKTTSSVEGENHEHKPLEAKKSISIEDVRQDYDDEVNDDLKRSSATRRSLNLHKDYHWSSEHTNELENVFKRVLKNKTFYNRTDLDGEDLSPDEQIQSTLPSNKKSFVSVETIQNIRNNLKPVEDAVINGAENNEDNRIKGVHDNYIENTSPVKNYNTGSLENKQNKSEEWYNRRKSYGFEQMKDMNESQQTSRNSLKNIESSTDSGIAKSNENIDTLVKKGIVNPNNDSFVVRRNSFSRSSKIYNALMSLRDSNKKLDFENGSPNHESQIINDQYPEHKNTMERENENNGNSSVRDKQNEPLFITIKPKEEHTSVINIPNKNEMKIESTMNEDGEYFRKVREIYDKGAWAEDKNGDSKKPKKVEFSKTEVHFEPGKVNIIETNEKPPPVNYRRKKKDRAAARNAERAERNADKLEKLEKQNERGLFPEIKFGDEVKNPLIALPYESKVPEPIVHDEPLEKKIEIIVDETSEDELKKPKGILKSGKIEETTNENVDQTKTDFQKILNSFKTSERQNSTGSPPIIDNGLKVRISSGNNQFDERRASWCVPENANKYSTKINFGADNITVLPQKTRYSYCEPSERTIQSICSQSNSTTDCNGFKDNDEHFDDHRTVSNNNTPSSDEYNRFRNKSPVSGVSKTIIVNSKSHVPSNGSEDLQSSQNRKQTLSKGIEEQLENVPRRRSDVNRPNDLSSTILNRYSYTESTKSPGFPNRSPRPTRYSYNEGANSTLEPVWYQNERGDPLNINCQDKLIVHIGPKVNSHDKNRVNHIQPLFLKTVKHESEIESDTVANNRMKFENRADSKRNEHLKSTKLVLQAKERTTNSFTKRNTMHPFQIGSIENKCDETLLKNVTEINSTTFLENVVVEPIESFINKSPSLNDSSFTNHTQASSGVLKISSFPCSSKTLNNSMFPSYRKSYLIAIGAENEIHKDNNTKTYPRRKERNDMNVKLLELNKELPPRSPSKQFLSVSFDNILDGRLPKNNDLTEPLPLIVPLNETSSYVHNKLKRSCHSNEKKLTESSFVDNGDSFQWHDNKRKSYGKSSIDFEAYTKSNGNLYYSDTSTACSSISGSQRKQDSDKLNLIKSFVRDNVFNNIQDTDSIIKDQCDDKSKTVQNDLIPSVLSDLDNLSKSIDEEIFDIPNKIKRRPSILDDDIYCLESNEKNFKETRRHKNCFKCNYDKNNGDIANDVKNPKRYLTVNVKARVNLLRMKSDEECKKTGIHQLSDMDGLKNKINCKKKTDIKKIKSIEDLKINKLLNTLNKNYIYENRSQNNKDTIRNCNKLKNTAKKCATGSINISLQKSAGSNIIYDQTTPQILGHKNSDFNIESEDLKLELVNEKLSKELEELTSEFKRSIFSERPQNSSISENISLGKILSENEIYDLLNSEKVDKTKEFAPSLLKVSPETRTSQKSISDLICTEKTSQIRCDNFKHDFNNSKFKLINAATKRICDISAHRNSSSLLLLNGNDAELSDDSLKADEEVRTLLMHSEERNNTDVQQWNGGASSHSITINQSITTTKSNPTNIQISTATTNILKEKSQLSFNGNNTHSPKSAPKKESASDPVQITSISLHYEPKLSKAKTFQPVCLIYKPESPTNKSHDHEVTKSKNEATNENSRTRRSKEAVHEKIKEVKRPNKDFYLCDQKAQTNKITNELKKINECIKLSSHNEKVTRRTEKVIKDDTPKRPARKVKDEPIYEKIQHRSKREIETNKSEVSRLRNSKENKSLNNSGRDGWLNIPKDNGHVYENHSKDPRFRSRDSSVESNHTLTNRSRTSSLSSNIRSRTSSLESNSQLHSAVLAKYCHPSYESEQRSRTSSIESNRSANVRNQSRVSSNNSTPVRSRTSSIESDRSYQGICKPKSDLNKSRLNSTSTRRFTTTQTRDSRSKVTPVIENKRSTKQLLESANKGICPNEISKKSKQYLSQTTSSRSRNSSADSTILEELTKAADEILLAVNGYTDEDSVRGSDDERRRRKSYKPLSTIVETPIQKNSSKQTRKSETPVVVRENVYSNVRTSRKSSNSSLENNEKLNARIKSKPHENIYANIKPVKQSTPIERAQKKKVTRIQRTSSREILESSSDDQNQEEIRNKKVVRRSKTKTTNQPEVCQSKKIDKAATSNKTRSSSVIRSVANHIIEHVNPALAEKEKNSTEKKSLKNSPFSKQSMNGTKSSRQQDSRSSTAQTCRSLNVKTSSSTRRK